MSRVKSKYEFHLSKTDWKSAKDKWAGIVKSLQSRNERELLEFFDLDCGFCDETERCWAGEESRIIGSEYCKICPLHKNNLCVMGGNENKAYWKIRDFVEDVELETISLEECNKKTLDRIIRFAQKILDAIIAAKPARFRKEE